MNTKFKDYNIIPIGDHCAVSIILKELNLRKQSYPFDWTSNRNELYDTNLIYHIELIKKINLDNVKSIVTEYIGNALETDNKVNTSNNICFPHVSNDKTEVFEKCERRFARLYTDLITKKNIFIIITRNYFMTEDKLNFILDTLLSFNNENILIYISGIDHGYINNKDKYKNVIFKHIYYDINRYYGYDYEVFRPEISKYLQELLF